MLTVSHFYHKAGILHAEDVAVPTIADSVGTPFYCYSSATMLARYHAYAKALAGLRATVYYAVKANSNLAVIRTFASAGAGADVVSVGEIQRSLAAGIPADKIVFAGVGKTREELAAALKAGIHQINIESEAELRALSEVAQAIGAEAKAGLRVNPDVDARTHAKITTGRKENKFGIDLDEAPQMFTLAAALPGVSMTSLSVHIGSQLTDISPYRDAYARLRDITLELRAAGHPIDHLDLGGGLGIAYDAETPPNLEAYAAIVREQVGDLDCALSFEPGRYLVGDAGILVTRVVYVKQGGEKRFVIADAAMNDLIRPTLYEAYHEIVTVAEADPAASTAPGSCDLVGPICESGDYLAKDCALPVVAEGDLLAIRSAGAYGAVMSSTYNSRPLIPEVLINAGDFAVIRRRQSVEEAMDLEQIPDWLDDPASPEQA
jgi:diaminopimelate decarboxylase